MLEETGSQAGIDELNLNADPRIQGRIELLLPAQQLKRSRCFKMPVNRPWRTDRVFAGLLPRERAE
jgi:hypothetical protein